MTKIGSWGWFVGVVNCSVCNKKLNAGANISPNVNAINVVHNKDHVTTVYRNEYVKATYGLDKNDKWEYNSAA